MASGNVKAPLSWFTIDHMLGRLQGKLQKSHETRMELHKCAGAINVFRLSIKYLCVL